MTAYSDAFRRMIRGHEAPPQLGMPWRIVYAVAFILSVGIMSLNCFLLLSGKGELGHAFLFGGLAMLMFVPFSQSKMMRVSAFFLGEALVLIGAVLYFGAN